MEENYERIPKILTHLFGGSAGREGTTLQIGGSVADSMSSLFKLNLEDRKTLLLCV